MYLDYRFCSILVLQLFKDYVISLLKEGEDHGIAIGNFSISKQRNGDKKCHESKQRHRVDVTKLPI